MAANLMERLGIKRQERVESPQNVIVANYYATREALPVIVEPLQAAIDVLREDSTISISMLRRMFNIPYGVAARLKREAKRNGA